MSTTPAASSERPRRDAFSAALWGSAAVLAGLIVAELAGPGVATSSAASGGSPSVAGDMTIIPAGAGDLEDVLIVLDGRAEKLSVYSVTNARNKIDLLQSYELARLFQEARQAAGAQPRP